MKRVLGYTLTAMILITAVGIAAIYLLRGGILEAAIESYGSQALGVEVSLEDATLELAEGRATLTGLSVVNPPGFSGAEAFGFDEVSVRLDAGSFERNLVAIQEVRVRGPRALLELDPEGRTNLQVLQANLARVTEPGDAGTSPPSDSAAQAASGPRVRIEQVAVAGGSLTADLSTVGQPSRTVNLPPLEISDVGGADGVPPRALAKEVARAWLRHLQRTAARGALADKLGELLDERVGEDIGGALRGILRGD